MNYIKTLQAENKGLKAERDFLLEGLADLRNYVNSPKFHCGDPLDGKVHVEDILLRVREITSESYRVNDHSQ